MININKNPFEVERLRDDLAKAKKYKELIDLYNVSYPEIPDKNNSSLWDKLNKREELLTNPNYMERNKLSMISREIKIKKDTRILNIGFGSGNLEELIFSLKPERSFRWYGIDISTLSVKSAKGKYKMGSFKTGDINALDFKDNYFNYIIALEVLEHIPPKKILNVLSGIKKKLSKKGYFILSIPLNEGLEEMVKKGFNPNAHVRMYTKELIKAELQISGFKIVKSELFFAFRTNYRIKSFLVRNILKGFRKPNGIVIVARKK
jgi:SAM-dependent methyltransferase